MDNSHHWWHGAAAGRNDCNNKNINVVGNGVDLTLKLGLPDNCDIQYQNPMPLSQLQGQFLNPSNSIPPNHPPLLSFLGPNTTQLGMNHLGMVNEGAMAQSQQSLNRSQYARPWPSNQLASNVRNMNYASALNQYHVLPTRMPANSYKLIDVPVRRTTDQREVGGSSSSSASASALGKRGQRRQRGGNYNDPNKRCTNYNCNTNDTPMWRKGPLGPKTLCNACGIKYRKEEEKRITKEAGSMSRQSNPNG